MTITSSMLNMYTVIQQTNRYNWCLLPLYVGHNLCHMLKVLLLNCTNVKCACMVGSLMLQVQSTYKLNSKKCWSNYRQYVWGMHTNYTVALHNTAHTDHELVCEATHAVGVVLIIEGPRPPTKETRVVSHVNRRGVQSCDCQLMVAVAGHLYSIN